MSVQEINHFLIENGLFQFPLKIRKPRRNLKKYVFDGKQKARKEHRPLFMVVHLLGACLEHSALSNISA